jgi:hypothetical protein
VKNASALATLLAVLMVAASPQSPSSPVTQARASQSLPASSNYIFRVPVFSGTELFESNPALADLTPPLGTIMQVFRTTDGRPLDKETVIAFFRDSLERKGWKEGISKRQKDEPYLSMRTDLFEALPDGTRIQIAGDFYLWVAPQDGTLTVYIRQWRISSAEQATHDSVQTMVRRLMESAPKAGYRAAKVYSDSEWKTDFENEYLIDRVVYALMPADAPSDLDAPLGTLFVTLLAYRDGEVAVAEKARREQEEEFLLQHSSAAVKGKIVVTIEGDRTNATKEKCASILHAITLP